MPPAQSPIDTYLASLGRELRRRGVRAEDFVAEARDHLDEAARSNLERGCPADIAELEAISRFGSPATLAEAHAATSFRRRDLGLLLLASLAGLLLATVDALPTWDDTGVIAGLLLLVAAGFGLLAPCRPWRWGLALGSWVPLFLLLDPTTSVWLPGIALILAIPTVGAYVGRLVRTSLPVRA